MRSRVAKIGVVLGGYVAAFAAASVAAWLYDVRTAAMPYDTSGGMYAAGQGLQALGVFLLVAMVPTLLGLWFLRGQARLWNLVAAGSVAFAVVGLIAVVATLMFRGTPTHLALVLVELLGLAQLLGVPLWAGAFAVFALIAPTPESRKKLVTALAIEGVIGVYAVFHWFGPR